MTDWFNAKFVADTFKFFFYFSEKPSLDISCELSAKHTIHMKCQDVFSLKNKKNVVCCSCDWCFKG